MRRSYRGLHLEQVESRSLMAITVVIDYTYDTNNFFDTAEKRELLQLAADTLVGTFSDVLQDITPNGPNNSWAANFPAPDSGELTSITNLIVPRDTLIVYAGGYDLGGSAATGFSVGRGGPGGWSVSGPPSWQNRVSARGQSGALATPATDFGPWGGAITFTTNPDIRWHFGESTDGLDSGEVDFWSVATHEMGHLLGYGTSSSWQSYVDAPSQTFFGPMSVEEYDGEGNVPVTADRGHWADGTTEAGQATLMDPSITRGARSFVTRLDLAGLDDIGWAVNYPSENRAPNAVKISHTQIAENSPAGTAVGTLSTQDPDSSDTSFTYALVSGTGSTDNDAFRIVDDELQIAAPLNFEAKSLYFVRVRTTDLGGLSVDNVFSISATNVNEPPTRLLISSNTIAEAAAIGSVVGSFTSSDPDAGDVVSYSLVDGENSEGNAQFRLVGDQLQTAGPFNAAIQGSYSIRVRATDSSGLSTENTFLIAIIANPRLLGDFDFDADVDSADLLAFVANWTGALEPGTGGRNADTGDLDADADVDSNDLLAFLSAWTGSQNAQSSRASVTDMIFAAAQPSVLTRRKARIFAAVT